METQQTEESPKPLTSDSPNETTRTLTSGGNFSRDGASVNDDRRSAAARIEATLSLLGAPGQVVEVRILHTNKGTVSGYYTDFARLSRDVLAWNGRGAAVYVTLNPLNPALLSRAANHLIDYAKNTTNDADIVTRRWMLIDLDPKRPAGISSTNEEHEAALDRARDCLTWLRDLGFTSYLFADSGNGAHVLLRIDLPNDKASADLVKRCLESVALQFSDTTVEVDLSVFNAARICKLYGTLSCKGDNTPERPHRLSQILKVSETQEPATHALIETLAALAPEDPQPKTTKKNGAGAFDLDEWIAHHHLNVSGPYAWTQGRKWIFSICPFNADHTNRAAVLLQFGSGAIGFRCLHNGCTGNDWHALRTLLEPGWETKSTADTRPRTKAASDAGTPATEEAGKEKRPTILITTNIPQVVDEAEAALLKLPTDLHLFQRIDQLCFVTHSATPPTWLKRPVGAPSIAYCSTAQLRERMSRAARWEKTVVRSKERVPALPPEWAVETLHGRLEWKFPVLADVISSPTLREDGEIISAPGYDRDTGLFLYTQGVIFPPIPPRPTLDEARRAVEALSQPFIDFPFAGLHGISAILSAILSLVARSAVNGCVPLFAVDSNTRGAGKGLLIDVPSTIATGRPAPRWAQTRDEEEDRKALLTIGMEGDACVHIDNLTHALGSGPLDSALTARTIKGRLLRLNKTAEVPMNCVFFASGNNISYAGDTSRRVVPIQLESLLERPEDRDDFEQPELLDWVRQERPRLVVEALTILRAFFVVGCPKQGFPAYGSFEAWSNLVRSALVWAGCADPCEGRKGIEAASDPGYENLSSLLHCWDVCYPSEAVTLNRVIGDVSLRSEDPPPNKWRDLSEALAAFDSRYDGKRLDGRRIGNALRTQKGRVIDGLRLIQAGTLDHALQWEVKKV